MDGKLNYYITIRSHKIAYLLSFLKVHDVITAEVVERLGKGYYILQIKNILVRAYSYTELPPNPKFEVISTNPVFVMQLLDKAVKVITVDEYVNTSATLSTLGFSLANAIVKGLLKYQLPIDDDTIIKFYNFFKKLNVQNEKWISFFIALDAKGISLTTELYYKMFLYAKLLNVLENRTKDIAFSNWTMNKLTADNLASHLKSNNLTSILNDLTSQKNNACLALASSIIELVTIEGIISTPTDEIDDFGYFSFPIDNDGKLTFVKVRYQRNLGSHRFCISVEIELNILGRIKIYFELLEKRLYIAFECEHATTIDYLSGYQDVLTSKIKQLYPKCNAIVDYQLLSEDDEYFCFLEEIEEQYTIPKINVKV